MRLKEKAVAEILDSNAFIHVSFYDFMTIFLSVFDEFCGQTYSTVFKCIYKDKLKGPKWKIATLCHVSESTLFRQENAIVDIVNLCCSHFNFAEIAVTDTGENSL